MASCGGGGGGGAVVREWRRSKYGGFGGWVLRWDAGEGAI